ncbi:hypothetical protein [Methylobacterium durans]|uniref:Uncharacterized protein n=1 Tax=Methylobacterium durans TaxID=2202825 RepID=A0A2U8W7R6_9HYPH|nr:hypothetical protein [Methylobacterium durans]AWN41422.1 hypothetical protein DK389_13980 [Methylobacterium durans]
MTSERVKTANRQNAQASNGPRTAAGKQRASQNARSHGPTAARLDATADAEVARLFNRIASEHASDPEIADAARTLAEAQVSLARIMSVKARWIREEMETGNGCVISDGPLPAYPSGALLQKLECLRPSGRATVHP